METQFEVGKMENVVIRVRTVPTPVWTGSGSKGHCAAVSQPPCRGSPWWVLKMGFKPSSVNSSDRHVCAKEKRRDWYMSSRRFEDFLR